MDKIEKINLILATGSVDGILTSAALLRLIGKSNVGVEFTQAFVVDKVDPSKWAPGRQVALVDLAVNNKDQQMTTDFVRRVRDAGHTIVAVIDEHDAIAWETALGGLDDLVIGPKSQAEGRFKSSGVILLAAMDDTADDQTRELCEAADAGDRMDFTTHFGSLANQAVKSAIWDNSRRVYLARYFAANHEPDEKILGWCAEYEEILRTHEEVLKMRDDLGSGIVRLDCTGKTVDMTTLMGSVYKLPDVKVCIVRGEMFNPAKKTKMVMSSFGTRIKDFDILSVIKGAGVSAGGFASKANVALEDEAKAIEAVRKSVNLPKIFSFDAETNGLWGDAFAISAAVYTYGEMTASFVAYLGPDSVTDGWVREKVLPNLVGLDKTHDSYDTMLADFAEFYKANKADADVIVHMGVPVEAKVLIDMHRNGMIGNFDGPYPLIDVAGVLKAKGFEPTSVDSYNKEFNLMEGRSEAEGLATHHPLYDSVAATVAYMHLLQ